VNAPAQEPVRVDPDPVAVEATRAELAELRRRMTCKTA